MRGQELMLCATCHLVISDDNWMQHNGVYYHAGDGRWDAASCVATRNKEVETSRLGDRQNPKNISVAINVS